MDQNSDATRALMTYVDENAPIPWVPLYRLPDYTYFDYVRVWECQ